MVNSKSTTYITDPELINRVIKSFKEQHSKEKRGFWIPKNLMVVCGIIIPICGVLSYFSIKRLLEVDKNLVILKEVGRKAVRGEIHLRVFLELFLFACLAVLLIAIIVGAISLYTNILVKKINNDAIISKEITKEDHRYAVLYFGQDDNLFGFDKVHSLTNVLPSDIRDAVISNEVTKRMVINLKMPIDLSSDTCSVDTFSVITEAKKPNAINERSSYTNIIECNSQEQEFTQKMKDAVTEITQIAPSYKISVHIGILRSLKLSDTVELNIKTEYQR